jgi:hypothetical protein
MAQGYLSSPLTGDALLEEDPGWLEGQFTYHLVGNPSLYGGNLVDLYYQGLPSTVYGVAAEDSGGYFNGLFTVSDRVVVEDGAVFGGGLNSVPLHMPLGVAVQSGQACVSQDQDGLLSGFDYTQTSPQITSITLGQSPWSVAMTNLASDGSVCTVFDPAALTLSVVHVPDMKLLRSVVLSRFTPLSGLQYPPEGGWQLAIFSSGPAAGIAAVLSQNDQVVAFVDLASGTELRDLTLAGGAFRIGVDNPDGLLVVAWADTQNRLTRFEQIDAQTGVVTQLQAVSPELAAGFGISYDGTTIYVGTDLQVQMVPRK